MSSNEMTAARVAILAAIDDAQERSDRAKLGVLLCGAVGHPPIVDACLGQLTCVRCGEIVGDTLMGASTAKGLAIVGRDCRECRAVIGKLSEIDRLLLPEKVHAFIAAMTAASEGSKV